jgi:tetratricopeptide (TPR) repeat protein
MAEQKVSLNDEAMTLYRRGLSRACDENYGRAIISFQRALDCIEHPRASGKLESCILTSLGDAHWSLKEYTEAVEAYEVVLGGMSVGQGHPYLHLRIGQYHLDAGSRDLALEHLQEAYEGGEGLFEFEDPRYLRFLESEGCL